VAAGVKVAGLGLSQLTEQQVVAHLVDALRDGRGGWVATPNVDICRAARRDPAVRALIGQASLTVADGMPLLWAARLRGTPLPERQEGVSFMGDNVDKHKFQPVHFAFDSYAIDSSDEGTLQEVAQFLQGNPNTVIIAGFTDERGTPEYNRGLGESRAEAVRDALKAAGIAEDHIILKKPETVTGGSDAKEARRVQISSAA